MGVVSTARKRAVWGGATGVAAFKAVVGDRSIGGELNRHGRALTAVAQRFEVRQAARERHQRCHR